MTARSPHALSRRVAGVLLGMLPVFAGPCPAGAQMQLPGTVNGGGGQGGEGSGGSGGGSAPSSYAPPKPVAIEAPGEDSIAGRALSHDGGKGAMVFDRAAAGPGGGDKGGDRAGLVLTKLTLAGDRISKPGQACTVDVALSPPLSATAAGRPVGAIRYGVPLPACPFNVDILDGAALVTSPGPTCDFAAADCRVSPSGLWGPKAADIGPKRAKDLERERPRLETTMRANFRALLRKVGKDKAAVKAVAREQAAFSSEREMTCRDYEGETVHGFCSTRVTEARALALLAQFGPLGEARKRVARPRPRVPDAKAPDGKAPAAPVEDAPAQP